MDQGTEQWHKWRMDGIGSSDVAAVLGVSKWKKKDELFREKVSQKIVDRKPNYIQEKGHRLEPIARAHVEMRLNESFQPRLVQMEAFPFMRASLDGCSPCGKVIMEVKYQGAEAHKDAKIGHIPAHYRPQVQHALLVSGAEVCLFVSIDDAETVHIVQVPPEREYQESLLLACTTFWQSVLAARELGQYEPEYHPLDRAKRLVRRWKNLKGKIEALETELEKVKEEILSQVEATGKEKLECGDLKIRRETRVGNIQYKDIPELKEVDLEKYRGKSSSYWKFIVAPKSE